MYNSIKTINNYKLLLYTKNAIDVAYKLLLYTKNAIDVAFEYQKSNMHQHIMAMFTPG